MNSATPLPDLSLQESFRDSVATISKEGKRNYIHPKKPKGRLYNLRTWFSIFYLVVFFSLPFIKLNGEPIFMMNVLERRFIIFGMVFWPQDFFLFGLAMITFVVFVTLFTVVFGRIFCGWACPQTIFMEMVFRKIEYWIDGDYTQQLKLKKQGWTTDKIFKRSFKFTVFYLLSFIIANFFLAYIIGMDKLIGYIHDPAGHIGTLASLFLFTTIFFFVYWWFREQACIVVCPYGRLQGVLLDRNSIVVAYDHLRGEPRGRMSHQDTEEQRAGRGDCVDCYACVRVCPTGIDIRNGTQLECINCTACMDACDAIMYSIHKPAGLVRYASQASIAEKKPLLFTNRIKAYSAVLILLLGLLVFLLVSRTDLDVRLMRTAGMTYTALPDGRVSNLYNLKLVNKTHRDIPFTVKLEKPAGEIFLINKDDRPVVSKEDYKTLQFFIKLNRKELKGWKTPVEVGVYDSTGRVKLLKTTFIGPEEYY